MLLPTLIQQPIPSPQPDDQLAPPAVFDSGWLPVSGGHRIAYTQRGNPAGIAAVVFHGGPGSGSSPKQACFFDPAVYRIIQVDQRGCGLSEPAGELAHNRTQDLLADAEALRGHLGIRRWLVVGGSWGATLAVLYAARHPDAVSGLLLRALFLCREHDLDWFFHRAAAFYPRPWADLSAAVADATPGKLLASLKGIFRHGDSAQQCAAARAWFAWERALGGLAAEAAPEGGALHALCRRYRIQSHYLANACWLGRNEVVTSCARLGRLPVLFLHGLHDAVCPPAGARQAHRACPDSVLRIVAGAGHDPFNPTMVDAMRRGLTEFSARSSFLPP